VISSFRKGRKMGAWYRLSSSSSLSSLVDKTVTMEGMSLARNTIFPDTISVNGSPSSVTTS
jgi:hypothetical protein